MRLSSSSLQALADVRLLEPLLFSGQLADPPPRSPCRPSALRSTVPRQSARPRPRCPGSSVAGSRRRAAPAPDRAGVSTSAMVAARWNVMTSRTSSGTSSRSGPLRSGRTTSVSPARWAASTFCLTPPIGQHPSLQRDLAGHADHRAHRHVAQQADQRGGHGDARRWPVLGHGPGGDVHVEALAGERRRVDPELLGVRAHVGEGDLRRLLHDVAQLTGQGQALGPVGHAGLDEEDVAAGAGHGQAGHHAGDAGAVRRLEEEVRPAEPAPHVVLVDDDRRRRAHRRRAWSPPCAAACRARARGSARRLPGCSRPRWRGAPRR